MVYDNFSSVLIVGVGFLTRLFMHSDDDDDEDDVMGLDIFDIHDQRNLTPKESKLDRKLQKLLDDFGHLHPYLNDEAVFVIQLRNGCVVTITGRTATGRDGQLPFSDTVCCCCLLFAAGVLLGCTSEEESPKVAKKALVFSLTIVD